MRYFMFGRKYVVSIKKFFHLQKISVGKKSFAFNFLLNILANWPYRTMEELTRTDYSRFRKLLKTQLIIRTGGAGPTFEGIKTIVLGHFLYDDYEKVG